MNKWSLLLFSVLGLLLSTTSELNFVDGRLECCNHSSRPLLSDTTLSIYETHCPYRTFTEISQLISPKRDIRYDTRSIELKRSSRSDGRRRQFESRRISSDERFRVSNNVIFDLEDSTLSNAGDRKVLRENNDLYLRRNLKSFSRKNFRDNHVYRSRSRNNNFLGNKMERNSRERRINIEEELSEIRDRRLGRNDHNQERFNRRTFVIKTYIMPNERENFDGTERNNLDITTRQRLFRDTRLPSDLSRISDRRLEKDDRSSNERQVTMQSASKIGSLRNGNIQDYLRSSAREDSIVKMYERESLTNVRQNIDMDGTIRAYRRDVSEEMVPGSSSHSRTIQRESEGSRNRIRDDKRQMDNGYEKRFFKERYLTRGLPRQNSNINRLQDIRQMKFYKDINIKDGEDHSNAEVMVRIEGASDQNRNRIIRENNREVRLKEECTAESITSGNKNSLAEKRAVSSNINRRSEANRRSVSEARERENYRFRLNHESENIFRQSRIRNSQNEDMLRESRNRQRGFIRSNVMRQENNIMQIYDDDNVFQGYLVREDNYRELVNMLGRERLSRTGNHASQIRIVQRKNKNKMHIRAINFPENRIQENSKFIKRVVSNTNRNVEKERSRIYNDKSDREEFRNSLVLDPERTLDESRIRQVRDKHDHKRDYKLNVERNVERDLTRIDRNINNVVERGFLSIRSNIGNNRLYGITQNAITVLKRRENDEHRYRLAHENKRIVNRRRTRDMSEDRDILSNERLAQRNLASRDSMNREGLNNNRRSYNDENNPQVILTINRSGRERFSFANKPSSYLRTIQPEHENRMHNDYRQRKNIQEIRPGKERNANRGLARQDSDINRIVEDRRAKTPNEKLNTRNILASENKRSFDNSRISQQRDIFEYRLNKKVNAERVLVRNNYKVIERRDNRIRSEFDANHENQKTERTLVLLQLREKTVPSFVHLNKRDFEQNENEIVRNKQFTRNSRDIRIAQKHELRKLNVKSNTRGTHNNVITKYVESEVEFHDSDETHHERRTERVFRHIARHGLSTNNCDVNRKLEHIRHVRSYNGPENSAHRENKNNARIVYHRENNIRDSQDRERDIRGSDLQILNKEYRITKTRRTNEERELRTASSNLWLLPIEHKTQSNNQIIKINLQYIIYILQGLYILGLFTKFTESYNGIQKRTQFSNWFPLFSNLKVH